MAEVGDLVAVDLAAVDLVAVDLVAEDSAVAEEVRAEMDLAEDLRRVGYTVTGGH